jgi:hypothetical protein
MRRESCVAGDLRGMSIICSRCLFFTTTLYRQLCLLWTIQRWHYSSARARIGPWIGSFRVCNGVRSERAWPRPGSLDDNGKKQGTSASCMQAQQEPSQPCECYCRASAWAEVKGRAKGFSLALPTLAQLDLTLACSTNEVLFRSSRVTVSIESGPAPGQRSQKPNLAPPPLNVTPKAPR